MFGEGQPRTALGQFLMVVPGYRFAPPRGTSRSFLRDGGLLEGRDVASLQAAG
jgi:hypothetical protein